MGAETWMMSPTESDHDVTLTLPGEVETLRRRLVEAVERLGYKVISEQPLHAKRRARGSARWDCSIETLDYPRKLTVALKPLNELATLATFSYEIKSYMGLGRGDRRTLQCEAEAIAALAMQRVSVSTCTACGTEVTDDSRFCRKCGAPLSIDVAELEVLRLMEGGRRGHHNLTLGVILSLIAMLLPLILIWIDTTKAFRAVFFLSSTILAMGLFVLLKGLWQVHRTLNPRERTNTEQESRKSFAAPPQTSSLPPRSAHLSITEGTTELLVPEKEEQRAAVKVARHSVDTSEVR